MRMRRRMSSHQSAAAGSAAPLKRRWTPSQRIHSQKRTQDPSMWPWQTPRLHPTLLLRTTLLQAVMQQASHPCLAGPGGAGQQRPRKVWHAEQPAPRAHMAEPSGFAFKSTVPRQRCRYPPPMGPHVMIVPIVVFWAPQPCKDALQKIKRIQLHRLPDCTCREGQCCCWARRH